MTDLIVVSTTTASAADANRLAEQLVHDRLAACVQVGGPVRSHYRWDGRLQCEEEWTCTIKTQRSTWEKLQARIAELHPYDEPEILAVPVAAVSNGYGRWAASQVGDAGSQQEETNP